MISHVKKNLAILGSTGSIGTQTLDVIRVNPDAFTVEVLTFLKYIQIPASIKGLQTIL